MYTTSTGSCFLAACIAGFHLHYEQPKQRVNPGPGLLQQLLGGGGDSLAALPWATARESILAAEPMLRQGVVAWMREVLADADDWRANAIRVHRYHHNLEDTRYLADLAKPNAHADMGFVVAWVLITGWVCACACCRAAPNLCGARNDRCTVVIHRADNAPPQQFTPSTLAELCNVGAAAAPNDSTFVLHVFHTAGHGANGGHFSLLLPTAGAAAGLGYGWPFDRHGARTGGGGLVVVAAAAAAAAGLDVPVPVPVPPDASQATVKLRALRPARVLAWLQRHPRGLSSQIGRRLVADNCRALNEVYAALRGLGGAAAAAADAIIPVAGAATALPFSATERWLRAGNNGTIPAWVIYIHVARGGGTVDAVRVGQSRAFAKRQSELGHFLLSPGHGTDELRGLVGDSAPARQRLADVLPTLNVLIVPPTAELLTHPPELYELAVALILGTFGRPDHHHHHNEEMRDHFAPNVPNPCMCVRARASRSRASRSAFLFIIAHNLGDNIVLARDAEEITVRAKWAAGEVVPMEIVAGAAAAGQQPPPPTLPIASQDIVHQLNELMSPVQLPIDRAWLPGHVDRGLQRGVLLDANEGRGAGMFIGAPAGDKPAYLTLTSWGLHGGHAWWDNYHCASAGSRRCVRCSGPVCVFTSFFIFMAKAANLYSTCRGAVVDVSALLGGSIVDPMREAFNAAERSAYYEARLAALQAHDSFSDIRVLVLTQEAQNGALEAALDIQSDLAGVTTARWRDGRIKVIYANKCMSQSADMVPDWPERVQRFYTCYLEVADTLRVYAGRLPGCIVSQYLAYAQEFHRLQGDYMGPSWHMQALRFSECIRGGEKARGTELTLLASLPLALLGRYLPLVRDAAFGVSPVDCCDRVAAEAVAMAANAAATVAEKRAVAVLAVAAARRRNLAELQAQQVAQAAQLRR